MSPETLQLSCQVLLNRFSNIYTQVNYKISGALTVRKNLINPPEKNEIHLLFSLGSRIEVRSREIHSNNSKRL